MAEKAFMEITNRDIYDMIKKNHSEQQNINQAIITRLDTTNGKVKLNKWIATTAISLAIIAIGFAFK